ncbi:MAG TPA: hypothetical protein VFM40_00425 [Actinomycetota bacterium]|nr:hypothetical protein [Actinomycetota bacterium]
MSTSVGTLQAPRTGGSILLAAFLASVVMLTIAVVAISVDRDAGRQAETTFVGRQVVNTPSELSGEIVGGALANTPTELSAGIRHKYAGGAPEATTPSELSGGLGNGIPAEIYDRHQRG